MSQGETPERGADDAAFVWHDLARDAVTANPETEASADLIAERARHLRTQVAQIAADITAAVTADMSAPGGHRRDDIIADAVGTALNRFLDSVDGAPHRDRGVDELFRSFGHAEAVRGRSLTAFHAALGIATNLAWEHVRELDSRLPPGSGARGKLADALFAFVEHLTRQAEAGYNTARARRDNDVGRARNRLAKQLLNGQVPDDDLQDIWPVPDELIVAVTDPGDEPPGPSSLVPSNLVVRHDRRTIVIADAAHADHVVDVLAAGGSRAAVSWPVDVANVPSAYRWARRGLSLVDRGVIPDQPVIDCREHRTQIWLHAEPALRQRLCQDLLSPLLAETPNSREILSETLLVWLETRASAPAIAAKLGVHPQTVRYRWKRINELFGEDLHDPEFTVQITMLLKASVPLWKAGDQSDFERFRAKDGR